MLELNARPELSIQIANRNGLLPRLKHIEKHYRDLVDVEQRLSFSKENFKARN